MRRDLFSIQHQQASFDNSASHSLQHYTKNLTALQASVWMCPHIAARLRSLFSEKCACSHFNRMCFFYFFTVSQYNERAFSYAWQRKLDAFEKHAANAPKSGSQSGSVCWAERWGMWQPIRLCPHVLLFSTHSSFTQLKSNLSSRQIIFPLYSMVIGLMPCEEDIL